MSLSQDDGCSSCQPGLELGILLPHLPTYSSWLNWMEPEFAAPRYFALNGTDHRTHAEQSDAIARYLRWRTARA